MKYFIILSVIFLSSCVPTFQLVKDEPLKKELNQSIKEFALECNLDTTKVYFVP